ncbi:phosphatidylinositol 3,4,5-trisphosphate 3-phosphatase cnrN-like, partial [Musca vetustissima]|uniref:phosphatidylinositol 3,4,5-trisphosphate 3-phosphatase cnrN-like n=1 Tax=Musca vetustissima TaxID=27455 RepID=UPI002AB75168
MSKSISSAGAAAASGSSGLGGIPTNSVASPQSTTTAVATTTSTTTITSDPGILCFHHCNVKVFCFTLPHICPQCKTALDTHPNGGGGLTNKRPKSKKRTPATNNVQMAATKGHYAHSHGDVNNDNNRDNDDDQWHNGNDQQHQATMDQDSDDDGDDDDENSNDSVCHIMDSRLLPFRLPYPFVRANQYPCAIVLRPTTGDFLNDYNNTTDLHIAVTTSTGCVVEFDRHGLRRHRTANMSDWWQCLLVGDVPEPWYDYWDQVLFE